METSSEKRKREQLIAYLKQNNLNRFFKKFSELYPDDHFNELRKKILQQRSRYNELASDIREGIITQDQKEARTNKITKAIIEILYEKKKKNSILFIIVILIATTIGVLSILNSDFFNPKERLDNSNKLIYSTAVIALQLTDEKKGVQNPNGSVGILAKGQELRSYVNPQNGHAIFDSIPKSFFNNISKLTYEYKGVVYDTNVQLVEQDTIGFSILIKDTTAPTPLPPPAILKVTVTPKNLANASLLKKEITYLLKKKNVKSGKIRVNFDYPRGIQYSPFVDDEKTMRTFIRGNLSVTVNGPCPNFANHSLENIKSSGVPVSEFEKEMNIRMVNTISANFSQIIEEICECYLQKNKH